MSNSASELKQELINYKDKFLYPLYIRGELGAQQIPGFNNKCVTSFNVCDIPDDFDLNELEQEEEPPPPPEPPAKPAKGKKNKR